MSGIFVLIAIAWVVYAAIAKKANAQQQAQRQRKLNENVAELSETDNKLSSITLTSGKEIPIDGLFVAIGLEPDSTLFKGQIQTTENGYIVTDDKMRTSLKNVYAAGDIREKSLRQIVTAAADGAIAAVTAADEIQ